MEMQSVNNKALIEELNKLLERLRIPPEVCSIKSLANSLMFIKLVCLFPLKIALGGFSSYLSYV